MKRFTHITPTSIHEVIPLLSEYSRPLAGGTDVLTELKEGLVEPDQLVSLRKLSELRGVTFDAGVHIGALTTLTELSRHPQIKDGPYQALAQSARLAASPQLRNMATIGGNLLQDVRCWYYRGPFDCWLKGGDGCPARDGEHHKHALFEQSPCVAVQPSDPATALLALDATVSVAGPSGTRSVGMQELLVPPTASRRKLHTLQLDELITTIQLPARDGWQSIYLKAMERATYSFALVGVAVAIKLDAGIFADARIVLGGVANTPLLMEDAAQQLVGQPLNEATIAAVAQLATQNAQPLPHTHYKAAMVQRLVCHALATMV
ncbi:MAG: xanthine dehydrogenase family protein subunit M [Chloroflexi bacterium AL-W]|nr:xanthine dehydrogenase family protein subunit M [Chloroflexi bacterium AL-N1]NOK70777.1 xanthine dehydrogenase family protein subunit M [Chloroflexi bacterium AL-N10]NOK78337.1 xanthine dehydrogenase family protein subunit M [Chloroflexi bacterium AL-N5]NOK85680.1 xanthine dehydrogenase family protein subunit M [Chloroflexi bacterium AL-W]NOK92594.1 xanthine dehydrogenase family protein subunit M [Chloroflexi bacterium AL-N15]